MQSSTVYFFIMLGDVSVFTPYLTDRNGIDKQKV